MSISVVIGAYGSTSWRDLARDRAEKSVRKQGFHEVIVSYLEDGTLAQARNQGASKATGKWLLFLDADDELDPGFFEAMRSAMKGARIRSLFTPSVQYISGRRRPEPRIWPRIDFKDGNWCVIGTVISRTLFKRLGGFQEYGMYEDYALWAKADRDGATIVEVPDAIYVAHATSRSRNRAPSRQEMLFWHQAIGHDLWPEEFDEPSYSERSTHHLRSNHLRRRTR